MHRFHGWLSGRAMLAALALGAIAGATALPTAAADPAAGTSPAVTASPAVSGLPTSGRIAFGRVTAFDGFYGPIAALYAIDADGANLTQLTDGDSAFPAWSPDGTRLAFTVHADDGSWQLATIAADGSDLRMLTAGPGVHEVPDWSPDGTWLAYDYSPLLGGEGFHTTLYRINSDGSDAKPLGDTTTFDVEPRLSPDGNSVVFERLTFIGDSQHNALMVRDLATGTERAIDAAGAAVEHAIWSRDGQSILYNVSPSIGAALPNDQIETIAADGSGQPVVVFPATSTRGGHKSWYSPDGTQIAFGCDGVAPRGSAICVMNADGTDVRVLSDDPTVDENYVSWGAAAP